MIAGDQLLERNYPAIHTVGRASTNPPHLVDMRWAPLGGAGSADAVELPRVTLVGKGVCFDTGGLDIKPAGAMKLMKVWTAEGQYCGRAGHRLQNAQHRFRMR